MDEQNFTTMAGQMMRAGLDSWRSGHVAFAVLHTCMGCEHVLKALLAHYDPLLIAAGTDRALIYHAAGFGNEKGVQPITKAKTIGITEAFERAAVAMRGKMPYNRQQFEPVAESRNALVHLAYNDEHASSRVVSVAVAVAEAVRRELGVLPGDFWGEYETVFGDLAQVSTLPPKNATPGIEAGAERLGEEAEVSARLAAGVASRVALQVPAWGAHVRLEKEQKGVERVVHWAALWAALQSAGTAAQQAATELIQAHGLAKQPGVCHYTPESHAQARMRLFVKTLVASRVVVGFRSGWVDESGIPWLDVMHGIDTVTPVRQVEWESDRIPLCSNIKESLCPACGYSADLFGRCEEVQDWKECAFPDEQCDVWISEDHTHLIASVASLNCTVCSLTLYEGAEIMAAGLPV